MSRLVSLVCQNMLINTRPWQAVDAMLEARATTVLATSVVVGQETVEMEA